MLQFQIQEELAGLFRGFNYVFEIGGASKDAKQLKGNKNSYVVNDDVEIGFDNKIPLWLFGFLY